MPTDIEWISIHNNVKVATDMYFCTHDVLQDLFNDAPNLGDAPWSRSVKL